MNAPSPPEASAADKRIALFVATLSSFLAPFMISAVNIALPVIAGSSTPARSRSAGSPPPTC